MEDFKDLKIEPDQDTDNFEIANVALRQPNARTSTASAVAVKDDGASAPSSVVHTPV